MSSSQRDPISTGRGTRLFVWGWSTLVIGAIALVLLVVIGYALIGGPRGLLFGAGEAPRDSRASLEMSLPDPWQGRQFRGYERFTAETLNDGGQRHTPGITYVDQDVASTDRTVVSVNPIDEFSWGAASLSRGSGRCYAILVMHDRNDPSLGSTWYDVLPDDEPCIGSAATANRVTASEWP